MSLTNLLRWHKFTVQTVEHALVSEGLVNRRDQWITTHSNLYGHLQVPKTKTNSTVDSYQIVELEIVYVLYHNYSDLILTPQHRILIHQNPKLVINGGTTHDNIRVFQVVGQKEVVGLRERNLTLFQANIKQIDRQTVTLENV